MTSVFQIFQEPDEHMANVVLPTEEYGQNTDSPVGVVDVKPVDGPTDCQMPESGQDVVMTFAPMRSADYTHSSGTDFQYARRGMIERAFQVLTEAEVAAKQMIVYQSEVVFRFSRKLKPVGHGRGACRQSSG